MRKQLVATSPEPASAKPIAEDAVGELKHDRLSATGQLLRPLTQIPESNPIHCTGNVLIFLNVLHLLPRPRQARKTPKATLLP